MSVANGIPAPITVNTKLTAYKIPASVVADWPSPNYNDPERRSWLVPYAAVITAITTSLIAARLYSRWTKRAGSFAVDDILIIGAWMLAVWFTATSIYGVLDGGFDRHAWDVSPSLAERGAFMAWLAELSFSYSTALTKVSMLIFHRRLMARSSNKYIIGAIYVAIGFTIVYAIAVVIFLCFICTPLDASWKSMNREYSQPYQCGHRGVYDPMWGAISVASDVYAIILPMFLVKSLQVTLKQKIALSALFGCGILTVGAGIARTVWLARLSSQPDRDVTWIAFDILVWGVLECHLALVCASAPALKVFFDVYVVAPITRSRSKGSAASNSTYASDDTFQPLAAGCTQTTIRTGSIPTLLKIGDGSEISEKGIVVSTRFSLSSDVR